MKTYKIKNVEIDYSQVVTKGNTYIANAYITTDQIKALIKDNPELLEEKKVSGRYFFPKVDEKYFFMDEFGRINSGIWADGHLDIERLFMGIYRTREEAQLAVYKQKATVACWKWQQENAPFEPDWSDGYQLKWLCQYIRVKNINIYGVRVTCDDYYQHQFTLPYFKSADDCEAFIEANKAHLELLFTK